MCAPARRSAASSARGACAPSSPVGRSVGWQASAASERVARIDSFASQAVLGRERKYHYRVAAAACNNGLVGARAYANTNTNTNRLSVCAPQTTRRRSCKRRPAQLDDRLKKRTELRVEAATKQRKQRSRGSKGAKEQRSKEAEEEEEEAEEALRSWTSFVTLVSGSFKYYYHYRRNAERRSLRAEVCIA